MDTATLRRALYDFFKFNPKDFFVQASGTGYLVSGAKKLGGTVEEELTPLSVVKATNADNPTRLRVIYGTANAMQSAQHSAGDAVPCYFTVTGVGRIYGRLTGDHDTRRFTAFDIIDSPTDDNLDDTVTYLYQLLGSYDTSDPDNFLVANVKIGNYVQDFSQFLLPS